MKFGNAILEHASQFTIDNLIEMALKDPLTQLFNRNALYSEKTLALMVESVAKGDNDHEGCSIAVIDLDHFKRINDSYGHAAGDYVLTETARLIHEIFEDDTLQCRFGGEEFVLIHAGRFDSFFRKVEEFHKALPLCDMIVSDGIDRAETLSVTASIGVAEPALLREKIVRHALEISSATGHERKMRISQAISSLIQPADDAVYYAKEHGRNQIITALQAYTTPDVHDEIASCCLE